MFRYILKQLIFKAKFSVFNYMCSEKSLYFFLHVFESWVGLRSLPKGTMIGQVML